MSEAYDKIIRVPARVCCVGCKIELAAHQMGPHLRGTKHKATVRIMTLQKAGWWAVPRESDGVWRVLSTLQAAGVTVLQEQTRAENTRWKPQFWIPGWAWEIGHIFDGIGRYGAGHARLVYQRAARDLEYRESLQSLLAVIRPTRPQPRDSDAFARNRYDALLPLMVAAAEWKSDLLPIPERIP